MTLFVYETISEATRTQMLTMRNFTSSTLFFRGQRDTPLGLRNVGANY